MSVKCSGNHTKKHHRVTKPKKQQPQKLTSTTSNLLSTTMAPPRGGTKSRRGGTAHDMDEIQRRMENKQKSDRGEVEKEEGIVHNGVTSGVDIMD